jgi:DNA-binding CsgD family transcriptional regulator
LQVRVLPPLLRLADFDASFCHDRCEVTRVEIIGRDQELGFLTDFFDRAPDGLGAVVLEGSAGIGKSTLWRAGLEAARERGFRILSSRPAEAERGLAHAGLGDLFENVLDSVLPALSTPRRRALEVALLVEEAEDRVDRRTLGVAVRTALEALVAEQPIVLAVDDVQWLDPSSANALAFALRRLDQQFILLLLTRRLGEDALPWELEGAIEADRIERLSVGPLSLGATHRVLQARLGQTFARPTLLRVHEISGGNPFYALELGRALVGADVDPIEPVRVPETLEGLVRARLDGLPSSTRRALLLASAVGRPSAELLAGVGVTEAVLEPAFAAHVLERAEGTIRFTHPLLASVVYQGASADERRHSHGVVAQIVDDPSLRARHLALATEDPDTEVAAALEDAAALASARGAPIAAAELGEHALRLTSSDASDDHHRRAIKVARAHLAAGERTRARRIAVDLLARTGAGPARAEALLLLAELENLDRSVAVLYEALGEAAAHPALQAVIHRQLAVGGRLTEGRDWAEGHARASLELAESLDDQMLRAGALSVLAWLRFVVGDPEAPRLAERAYEDAAVAADPGLLKDAIRTLAHVLVWSVETARARTLLESQHREWSERDELWSAQVLWYLCWVELRAGRWPLAAEYAERARDVTVQYGVQVPQQLFSIGLVAAHRGDFERARDAAQRGAGLADGQGALLAGLVALPGLVDFWSGDAAAAAESFAAAEETATAAGWREPNMRWWRADYVEALLELGRIEAAVGLLDAWEEDAARVGREWVLAQVMRDRGLVAAARADVGQAQSLLEQAVAKHETAEDPFGRARALLALGVVRRRARLKRAAREAIQEALAGFEDLGAASWVDKARAELGHMGGRTRVEGLTPAERRVADLVAEGRTNREVAATLFLGERTVASHLTHIYAKLGLRSRTELARRLQ